MPDRVTMSLRSGAPANPSFPDSNAYTATLRYQGRSMSTPFYTGSGWTHDPSARDVLESLISDAVGLENTRGFDDWARDYGYEPDSRSAERTYRAVQKEADKLRRLLGADYGRISEDDSETVAASFTEGNGEHRTRLLRSASRRARRRGAR